MDKQLEQLVDTAWTKFQETPANKRFLIAVGGIPGSGKTTLSKRLTAALNARQAAQSPSAPPIAAFVPMDGYHYTRAQLDAMPDPATAHARRGAEFTFDGESFLRLVQRLSEPLTPATPTVLAPSFDHAVKDPVPDDIAVEPTHRIVVLEGNYLLLRTPPWSNLNALCALKVLATVAASAPSRPPEAIIRDRLVARHLAAGIVRTREEAERRVADNDLPNAAHITRECVADVDVVVESREDEGWA